MIKHLEKAASKKNKKLVASVEHHFSWIQKFVFCFVVIMPLLFCKWNDQSPFEMIKAYFSVVCVSVMMIWFSLKNFFDDHFQIRLNLWTSGLFIYTAIYLIAFSQAGHYYSSIFGVLNLPAGSVKTILAFVFLSFLATQLFFDRHGVRNLAYCFVTTTFLMSLYGIVQHFGGDPINWWVYSEMRTRALSTMGQSVGYGTVMGCSLPLAFAFLINSENRQKTILWSVVWACMNLGILYSGSRLPIFGYFTVMIIFFGFLLVFKKKLHFLNWKKVGLAYLILVLSAFAYFLEPSSDNALKNKLQAQALKEGYGTRFITWGTAIEMWKQHPWLGVGPENFGEEFNHIQTIEQNYGESWNLIWHKAHNEFIHYLATTGALGFAAYFMLIILMFVPVFKILKDPEWTPDYLYSVALLGGFGFLLLTHMTAFSFIPTLMFFYLFPAMNFNFAGLGKTYVVQNKLPQWGKYLASALVILVFGFVIKVVYGVWQADIDYNDARRALVSRGDIDLSKQFLDKAQENNPWNAEYYCFRADIEYNYLLRSMRPTPENQKIPAPQMEQIRRDYFNGVVKASDQCVEKDPRKSDLWRARGTLFTSLAQFSPNMLEGAFDAYKKAIEVYPNSPYNHLSMAQIFRKKGRNDLAKESLKTALAKRKDVAQIYAEMLSIGYQEKDPSYINFTLEQLRVNEFKKSYFYAELPSLVKIATDNGDSATVQKLNSL